MTETYIQSLGWIKGPLLYNRQFYYLGVGTIAVHLYDNTCYIAKNGSNIDYLAELNESDLAVYSDLLKTLNEIYQRPEEYSFKEYLDVVQLLNVNNFESSVIYSEKDSPIN